MAEGILRSELRKREIRGTNVSSMGIHALEGNEATGNAVEVCRENGVDIGSHRSRHLVPDELRNSRLILTMEQVQVDYITIFFPQVADRTFMLGAWPEQKSRRGTIKDPVGKSMEVYRKTFTLLQRTIDRLLPEITEWV